MTVPAPAILRTMDEATLRDARRRWLAVTGLFAIVAAFTTLLSLLKWYPQGKESMTLAETATVQGVHWGLWALLYPLAHVLVSRFPFDVGRRRRALLAVLAAAPVLMLAQGVLTVGVLAPLFSMLFGDPPAWSSLDAFVYGLLSLEATYRVLGFLLLMSAAWALEMQSRSERDALRASRLEAQLAHARLEALKMQLHPHFLFNTLNSVSALLHRDPEAADRMLARLGDFLRLTLHDPRGDEVSLEDELRFVRCYLEIEEQRYSDRLRTRIDVEPGVEAAGVPNLVLQPLVENAIRHGVGRLTGPGEVHIQARRHGGRLRLSVTDDGPGISGPVEAGVGLSNTRARLHALYGDDHRLSFGPGPDGGFVVDVELPMRPASR
jgi:two-component system LytT family sensor kinase